MRISQRTIFITLDLLLGAYLVFAITSFNKTNDGEMACAGVNINISDKNDAGFLSASDIELSLKQKKLYPDSTTMMKNISPRKIEEELMKDPFISNVQCYKTRNNTIHINVTQRTPVVRVKSENGEDYYVDARDSIMPRTKYQSNLLVATGNITKYYAQNYVAAMSRYIADNELWNSQIEQIYVRADKCVELIPRVGNHIVNIGRPPENNDREVREKEIENFMQHKLQRLEKFYRYGLSEAGWDTYSYINLEFDNQIICKRRDVNKHHEAAPAVNAQPQQKPDANNSKKNHNDKNVNNDKNVKNDKNDKNDKNVNHSSNVSNVNNVSNVSNDKKSQKKSPTKKN